MSYPLRPPDINIPKLSAEDIEALKTHKIDKNSPIYKKYIQPTKDREARLALEKLEQQRKERKLWWANNWIGLAGLVVAVIALVVSIIAILA